jgi:esterase/lipase
MESAFTIQSPSWNDCCALLIHGLTSTPLEVKPLAAFLEANGMSSFAPLLSGHALTLAELRHVKLGSWLKDVDRALEQLPASAKVFVVGESLGSLLSLHLALKFPERIGGVAILSVPLRFRRQALEKALRLLSRLPDPLLDKLGVQEKTLKKAELFRYQHECYSSHSVGAAARLVKLRRRLLKKLPALKAPVILFHDPDDHHLSPKVPKIFARYAVNTEVTIKEYLGGTHELLLGQKCDEIYADILSFIVSHCGEREAN